MITDSVPTVHSDDWRKILAQAYAQSSSFGNVFTASTYVTDTLLNKNFASADDDKFVLIVDEAQQESQVIFVSSTFAIENSATKRLATIQLGDPCC